MAKLYAGTSGFAYPSWKPGFYPAKLPQSKFLEYYASRLNLVEINYSFRRLVAARTFEGWIAATPPGFVFAPKAHQKITHILKLKDAVEFTRVFLETLAPLRDAGRLGPILFQLPPGLKRDDKLLYEFVRLLPADGRHVFEFRNTSWFTDEVYRILSDHNAALCRAESDSLTTPDVSTADFAYFRLRKSEYTQEQRDAMADQAQALLAGNRDVYALFKHEEDPAGALYAVELLGRVNESRAEESVPR
ncbi:MAG: DUF72 domain-containing protein [Bryobacteraceae bacterium]|jgi:Uncharacterized conserved protein|nr:DUF72 domain-containing protein [Bryobacteraceae bacterium]